ncbi:MAG TPA: UPF0182 family protein [Candidatus Dormibacteraeota bacterium]|nr:UPF0182 family protein [Candidatus Dormibacteraeota bacterium]
MSRRYRPFDPFERGGPFERGQPFRMPRFTRRFWTGMALFGLALLVVIASNPVVSFITDIEWYDALGLRSVYLTRWGMQWELFLGSFLLALAYLAVNVLIALRVRSGGALRAVGIRSRVLRTPAGWISFGAAAVIALILSGGAASQWTTFALFLHSSPTGVTDPVLGQDVSFYLLTLPFLHALGDWSLGLDFMAILLIAAVYSWRGDAFDFRPTPRALAHVSVLIAAFAVTLAATAWFGRYDLLFAHNGVVWGAGYADINARLPLYTFQAGIGIVLAGALLANAWLRRLWLPVAAAGLWIVVGIASQVYPAVVQGVSVTPNAQAYELPYIQREIAGTQAAYGLSNVTVSNFSGDQPLSAKDVQSDQVTVNNLRLWDYTQLAENYQQQQTIRTYYTFHDIDIDRYTVNGQEQQLEISGREIDTSKLASAAQNWTNQHLQYTHGYGVAASPVNAVRGEGFPVMTVGDLPPAGSLKITQPAVYFGEVPGPDDYDIAPTSVREFDYPQGSQDVFTNYAGSHGVPMNSTNRALWALRLEDPNLLVTQQLTDKSQLLYRRNIVERAKELAPFLTFDKDPYVAVVDGRIYWILDAYTTAATYPYAQAESFGTGINNINYVRNSVKVVIDAYEGTPSFYVVDTKDPLIKAYQATFPSLFQSLDAMPQSLRAHLRVPEDLFNVQVDIYATYHVAADVAGARVLFAREDVWAVPTTQSGPHSTASTMEPYYVLIRLPGEQNPEFLLIMPYTPLNKSNLVSWIAARSDGDHYGQYVAYVLPKDKVIFGPQQVANRINATTQISSDFTLFDQVGSEVQLGNLLVVPIGNSFLYFQPMYLRAKQAASLPELKRVILVDQDSVAYTPTLDGSIQQLVGSAPPTTIGPPPTSVYTPAQVAQIQGLIAQANQHYKAAYDALRRGDLGAFATEMAKVGDILAQLQQLAGAPSSNSTVSPTPSPSP